MFHQRGKVEVMFHVTNEYELIAVVAVAGIVSLTVLLVVFGVNMTIYNVNLEREKTNRERIHAETERIKATNPGSIYSRKDN